MTVRPTTFPAKLWTSKDERNDDKLKVAIAKAWDNEVSDSDKQDVKDADNPSDAFDILVEAIGYNPTAKTDKVESPAKLSEMTGDVVEWIKLNKEKADKSPELGQFIHETVDKVIELNERKIKFFEMLDNSGIDVAKGGSKPNPESNSLAARLGEYYEVPGKTVDSDPVGRHRNHDLADQLFGNGYVAEVNRLEGMGDDAKKEYGENKHAQELATARLKLGTLRKKFTEACDAVVAYRECNALAGIDVVISDPKSPKPFMLRERMMKDGKVMKDKDGLAMIGRTAAIALSDLEKYQSAKAKELFDSGKLMRAGSETTPGTMYDAVLQSKPPKKPRKPGGSQNQTAGSASQGNDVVIKNLAQYDSASAELGFMIAEPGFKAEWFNHMNAKSKDGAWENIDSLLSVVAYFKWLDIQLQTDDRALLKRAGAELDRRAEANKAPAETKAAA